VQLRIGREILMMGNMEAEGSTLWFLNSNYEHYDTVAYRGARSIRLNRGGGGTNSVSTSLLYRPPFNENWNVSFMGWMQTENARDVRLQLELWNSRSGGNQEGLWTIADVDGDLPWTWFWQDIQTPQNAWYYNITLNLRAPTSGSGQAWFDDVMLVRWNNYQNSPVTPGFPNNLNYIQVLGPLGMTQAVVTYRKDTVQ
jgi:hypothetical protein